MSKKKKTPKHPAHEKENLGGDILHIIGAESDAELITALRAQGHTVTAPRTLEEILKDLPEDGKQQTT
jgi:hypothetical protein